MHVRVWAFVQMCACAWVASAGAGSYTRRPQISLLAAGLVLASASGSHGKHVLQGFDRPTPETELSYERFFNSSISERETSVSLQSDWVLSGTNAMQINYTIEQTAEWGGFIDVGFVLQDDKEEAACAGTSANGPESAATACGGSEPVHDCSSASTISFWYNNLVPPHDGATPLPGRVHLRFILLEASDCTSGCDAPPGDARILDPLRLPISKLEHYYSFHHVLGSETGWKRIEVELVGDSQESSPFWRGWQGQVGNADHNYIGHSLIGHDYIGP